jgi:23S rRNA pseudouridine1911/1915/1917 synthase
MRILFEDNHLLVVFKPAGLLTQPSPLTNDSLETQAKAHIQTKFLHAMSRLDKPVSGIVVFAKTKKALSRLNQAQREGKCVKHYTATLDKSPNPPKATLKHHHSYENHLATITDEPTQKSKPCTLHYNTTGENKVEILLETGRTHQIRAQMAHIGCPIIGDHKYGSKKKAKEGEIALMHDKLEIPHPITKETLVFRN